MRSRNRVLQVAARRLEEWPLKGNVGSTRRPVTTLTSEEARALALRASGFGTEHSDQPIDILKQLGVIQLDSVNVLARSHELVPFSRRGVTPTSAMHDAIYRAKQGFEYWGHAASWLPMADFRYFLPRRQALRERWRQVGEEHADLIQAVLDRIRAEGPLGTSDFEDPRSHRGTWWDWKPAKLVLEYLFAKGDLMCSDRRSGFERVYDLPERVLPSDVDVTDPGPAEAARYLVHRAIKALGVATAADAVDYFRIAVKDLRGALDQLLEAGDVVEVEVAGWRRPAYATAATLAWPLTLPSHPPTFLSPFDNLTWNRDRTERVFDFRYRLEIYVPGHKRVWGYYVVPLLARGALCGRADLKLDRSASVLRVRALYLEGAMPEDAVGALQELATHLGARAIAVERVDPSDGREPIERMLGY